MQLNIVLDLKKIFIYITLLSLLVELSIIPAVFIDYLSNQKYYAEVLCLNKDRKELACNGKCVLMQKLDLASHKKDHQSQRQLEDILDLFSSFFHEQNQNLLNIFLPDLKIVSAFSSNGLMYALKHTKGLLDPPKF